jgi:choice-of-anchor A domain-containing protein
MWRKRSRVQLVSLMTVTSVALVSSKTYAQDPMTLTEIGASVLTAVADLKKGYDVFTLIESVFDPQPTTAQLIQEAVASLEAFIVDDKLPDYYSEARATLLAYLTAVQKPTAANWQAFDTAAYLNVHHIWDAVSTSQGARYGHALAGLYFQIMPRPIAVHINGDQWQLTMTGSSYVDDVAQMGMDAMQFAYLLVGGQERAASASASSPATDTTRQSVLFNYIKAHYDGNCLGSDDTCFVYFQTDPIVQAIQIGAAGIYSTLGTDSRFANMNTVHDAWTGGNSIRVDPNASWGHNWQGYNNAVWVPAYRAIDGVSVTGKTCPVNYGIVGIWQIPGHSGWYPSFLCQRWPDAPPWTVAATGTEPVAVDTVQEGTHNSNGMEYLSYGCAAPDFVVGYSDNGGFICRHRLDGSISLPVYGQATFGDLFVNYGKSMPKTGSFTALPAGTYLVGSQFTQYYYDNEIDYWYQTAKFPSGVGAVGDGWNQGTITTITGQTQRYPIDFSIFALNGVSNFQDAGGPVAAGGDVTASSFAINGWAGEPVGLVAGGNLSLTVGGVVNGITYAGRNGAQISPSVTHGPLWAGAPIKFPDAFTKLQGMSTTLSQYPAYGTVTTSNSTITLASADPNFTVFSLSADQLSKAYSIKFAFPVTSTVVINVSGKSVSMQNMGFSAVKPKSGTYMDLVADILGNLVVVKVTPNYSHIIWNFYEATSLFTSSVGIPGSMLAPLADATLQWGSVSGTLVASSVKGFNEYDWFPFNGNFLVGP